jgi:ATP-dependent Clp protease ATP-binding subunit ClpA
MALHADLMFERFTDRARRVVVLAQEEARQLDHNYIGTEHILLALVHEGQGVAFQILERYGMSLENTREAVKALASKGTGAPKGHIPFTPRAKKTLELSLREALQLQHNYIGTEHILLGVIREGEGVGAQVLKQHSAELGDIAVIRTAVVDFLAAYSPESTRRTRWLRRPHPSPDLESAKPGTSTELRTTPAADSSLSEAARLAGSKPVGSHHLLLAALGDPDTAAAKALAALGVDLDQARVALRNANVAGTSDEPPEEAGGRQMVIHVTKDKLTIEATDRAIVGAGVAALRALGDQAEPPGTIRGDEPAGASLTKVWQALQDSLGVIRRRATLPAESALPDSPEGPGKPDSPDRPDTPDGPDKPDPEAA